MKTDDDTSSAPVVMIIRPSLRLTRLPYKNGVHQGEHDTARQMFPLQSSGVILERWDGVMWIGLVWLRIGTGGELL
jgi:hypothetical protein